MNAYGLWDLIRADQFASPLLFAEWWGSNRLMGWFPATASLRWLRVSTKSDRLRKQLKMRLLFSPELPEKIEMIPLSMPTSDKYYENCLNGNIKNVKIGVPKEYFASVGWIRKCGKLSQERLKNMKNWERKLLSSVFRVANLRSRPIILLCPAK